MVITWRGTKSVPRGQTGPVRKLTCKTHWPYLRLGEESETSRYNHLWAKPLGKALGSNPVNIPTTLQLVLATRPRITQPNESHKPLLMNNPIFSFALV